MAAIMLGEGSIEPKDKEGGEDEFARVSRVK